jgi:iron-sulfur cluster assembly protein
MGHRPGCGRFGFRGNGEPEEMLKITPEAGLAIQRLAEEQGAPADGGLRIEALRTNGDPDYSISIAAMPDQNDQVIIEDATGARVMLDPLTAELVDEATLDVDDAVDSAARFRIKPGQDGVDGT